MSIQETKAPYREARQKNFSLRVEGFLDSYAPANHYERCKMECDLIMLIREVYTDAQEPLLKYFSRLVVPVTS